MDSTNVVGNIDTTGIGPGPHSDIKGVTLAFDLADEAQGNAEPRDISDDERWAEKAQAAGTKAEQEAEAEPEDEDEGEGEGEVSTIIDTTDTDTPSSNFGHEEVEGNVTDVLDTSGTGGTPNADPDSGGVEAASDLHSPVSATTEPREGDESGEPSEEVLEQWRSFKVLELQKLAKDENVEVASGANKDEIILALIEAGVSLPEPTED